MFLCVTALAACAAPSPAMPPAPTPDATATTPSTPAPTPSPAAAPNKDVAVAAPAPAPKPMPHLETGPDRYQVPSVFPDDGFAILIVDLATGTGTGLVHEAQRGKVPARWVTRRGKKDVVVEVERVDLPLPAGVEQKQTWANPDGPKSPDALLGEGWTERTIVLRGKRYRLEQDRVVETDPVTGNKRPLELPGFEVTSVFVAGDELALLGIKDEEDVLAMLDVAAGTLTREIPLPPSMDHACSKSELRFLGELVVLADQDRAYMGILCHHGQD